MISQGVHGCISSEVNQTLGVLSEVFLLCVRADGIPSLVEIVRSNNGGEFFGGKFASVYNELWIKQEFTPAYNSQ